MPAPHNQHTRLCPAAPHLLLLLTALPTALACQLHRSLPAHGLQLLHTMAPNSTQTCQHQQTPFFPDALRHNQHPHQAPITALRILHNLFNTLSSNNIPQHWDNQARHDLLNSLQQHKLHLQQCLAGSGTLLQGPEARNITLDINRYFRDIQHFLNSHNHSACAWQHVHLEARLCFRHLHNLTRNSRK